MQLQGMLLNALAMSKDTAKSTSPLETASSAWLFTRIIASIVERPWRKPNWTSATSGPSPDRCWTRWVAMTLSKSLPTSSSNTMGRYAAGDSAGRPSFLSRTNREYVVVVGRLARSVRYTLWILVTATCNVVDVVGGYCRLWISATLGADAFNKWLSLYILMAIYLHKDESEQLIINSKYKQLLASGTGEIAVVSVVIVRLMWNVASVPKTIELLVVTELLRHYCVVRSITNNNELYYFHLIILDNIFGNILKVSLLVQILRDSIYVFKGAPLPRAFACNVAFMIRFQALRYRTASLTDEHSPLSLQHKKRSNAAVILIQVIKKNDYCLLTNL
ncbi:hypothetical protein K1T71_006583 [Dendrolimus kikuchii]|uniref:Uncharacterized protein n=1 Tax=Dendrolimus kikuchii TaxID=765133 RepID=A0ACC1D1U4_9NEOP|nr:hypothetical protein K1T71_006583 [Dendrolimus kikuchii]